MYQFLQLMMVFLKLKATAGDTHLGGEDFDSRWFSILLLNLRESIRKILVVILVQCVVLELLVKRQSALFRQVHSQAY